METVISGSDLQIQERRDHFLNSLTQEESLQQHLIDQITLSDCDASTKENLVLLIGSLDENGYLNESPSNLSLQLNIPYPQFLDALDILKTFNPSGIGAKDLQECLLIQLNRKQKEDSLAYTIINEAYPLLLRRRVQEIAKKLKVSDEAIQKALEEIAIMDPSPGKRFSADTNNVIEYKNDVENYLKNKKKYTFWELLKKIDE